jgi:Cof subfamily protein (haloacid dehalogenase superfamily)
VSNPLEINEPIYKVALFHEESSERFIYPFVKHIEKRFKVKVSANHWVDISENKANKGHAIALIQEAYNITPEETMAFGDYNNDIEMLKLAKFSFAMENAHHDVKTIANFETKSNDENGVEYILNQTIKAKNRTI